MSHFVSSTGDENFENLNQQLLRREPVNHDDEEAEASVTQASDSPEDDGRRAGPSTPALPPGLAARRRKDLGGSRSVSDKGSPSLSLGPRLQHRLSAVGTRSPSYSRTNSPERQERARSPLGTPKSDKRRSIHDGLHTPSGMQRRLSDPDQPPPLKDESAPASDDDDPSSAEEEADPHKTPKATLRAAKDRRSVAFSEASPQRRSADVGQYAYEGQLYRHGADEMLHGDRTGNPRRHMGMLDHSQGPAKLGTFSGVFTPVTLNILGVILFLRFGFIMGQAGLLGALALLVISYGIDALTSMSISAIATNGMVRSGGIFYLASRSLGPEFGGATGLLFWLGQALNASLNALGFVETLTDAFGVSRDESGWATLPEGPWWSFAYGSLVLLLSTIICLVGSKLFVKATMILAVVLSVALVSIPVSSVIVAPFADEERNIYYTGWSMETFHNNLFPRFTSSAAGSSNPNVKENWSSVFGVLFPAVTGVLAGASMSGDLRKPSKSIPKGTNWSLLCTFAIYAIVFLVLAGTTARTSFYLDIGVMSDIAVIPSLITLGALASTAFSALMGIQACGKVLQAIARDHLLPVLDVFAQGTEVADTPTFGIFATYVFCQLTLLVDSVNIIAQLVTMTSLLCFAVISFACLALKAGGAPSFRPSFPYFNIYTAAAGTITSLVAMFFTDATAAGGCLLLAIVLFVAIHVFSPPKPWGDVTRNIHYWLTRKYLLRLDERKTNLKHWRPQVLLLANNPRTEWNLIIFCNSLKKGGLYILGHCIKGDFSECLSELRRQQIAWLKLVDLSGVKSFVDVVIANDEREGARSLILSAGLGGMRPNIVVLGFPRDLQAHARKTVPARVDPIPSDKSVKAPCHHQEGSEITIRGPHAIEDGIHETKSGAQLKHLPTDATRKESPITGEAYVGIIEDALALNKAVAVAYGFDVMQLPGPSSHAHYEKTKEKQYIDLWPVQIQSPDADPEHAWDTYTMILNMGTILSLTGTWKSHQLRVSVFVEDPAEVEEERKRVRSLLDNLRIPATLRVFCLSDGSVASYEAIVAGKLPTPSHIETALKGDPWWNALKELRAKDAEARKAAEAKRKSQAMEQQAAATAIPKASTSAPADGRRSKKEQRALGFTLPPEHMEYFKRNIRIGLSHPRANRQGATDDDDDDSGSDSDGSDLSDELLRLTEDDFFGAGTSLSRSKSQPAKRRSYSHHGLPDDPIRRPIVDQKDSPSGSYGSMSSTPIVRPDGTVVNLPSRHLSTGSGERSAGRDNFRRSISKPANGKDRSSPTPSSSSSVDGGHESDASRTSSSSSRRRSARRQSTLRPDAPVPTLQPFLSFNTLPSKAQYIVLNELFRAHSSSSATSVILTSLPAPEPGTARREEKVNEYLSQLEVLCAGNTPVLGIHAKSLTLSVSL